MQEVGVTAEAVSVLVDPLRDHFLFLEFALPLMVVVVRLG